MSHLIKIKELLPYDFPFLFVDEFIEITEEGAKGSYQFKKNEFFYQGHFKNNPVTPGAIMIETMAQIGLVGLGVFLMKIHENPKPLDFVFTSSEVEFLKKIFPEDRVTVVSEKIYFRFGKLKCRVTMYDEGGGRICYGTMAGMILKK